MKGIFIIILSIGLISCYDNTGEDLSEVQVGNIYDYHFENDIPLDENNTVHEAAVFTAKWMTYDPNEGDDYWQLPEESYINKSGDCEDFGILFAYILIEIMHIPQNRILFARRLTGRGYHISVFVDGICWEPMRGYCVNVGLDSSSVIWTASYSEVIWMTANYHDSVGIYL